MMKTKESEGDKIMKKATNLCKTSLLELRLKPDWNAAAPLYEQAMNIYKVGYLWSGKCWEKAKAACEKAAECQEHLGSSWHAGKMYEKAAEIAKEQNNFVSLAELYTHAAYAFFEAGRPQAGSEALYKAANKVEAARPEHASELYQKAIEALEQDERFSFGPDLYRSAVSHELKRERYGDAAGLLLKFAAVCSEKGLNMSVCRSYLGAFVIWLYAENAEEALSVFRDSSTVDVYQGSEEHKAAAALLEAYRSGNENSIKAIVADHVPFQFLDTSVGRLAAKLPTGNIAVIAEQLKLPEETERIELEAEDDLT